MTDLNKLRSEFEATETVSEILKDTDIRFSEEHNRYYHPIYTTFIPDEIHFLNGGWYAWQEKAKAQAVPEGHLILPKTPSYEMWSGIARHLGRYMQMHDRYCPKTLKKYFDRFIGDIPDWLNKEVKDWDSDHAFATADLPAFIYMSMIEASESGAEG
ncbi:hypothetical protein [Acinetobacter pittii]|uniref:hypothetical protein n=1 Tax=Acinetobacter pittii TaxID=48296 RepID=UPI0024698A3B|nr:hypothetical protein [Acinetobacter pittii]WGM25416.1 hypothetical protein OFU58_03710 [Acinetobacter pittii]